MDELKPLGEDQIKVEIRIDIPAKLFGNDVGGYFKNQQYLAEEEFSSSFDTEFALLNTLHHMSKGITDAIVEKLNAKRSGSQ